MTGNSCAITCNICLLACDGSVLVTCFISCFAQEEAIPSSLQKVRNSAASDEVVSGLGVAFTWLVIRLLSAANSSKSEEHTSELQSRPHLVCRLLLEKKKEVEQEDVEQYARNDCATV